MKIEMKARKSTSSERGNHVVSVVIVLVTIALITVFYVAEIRAQRQAFYIDSRFRSTVINSGKVHFASVENGGALNPIEVENAILEYNDGVFFKRHPGVVAIYSENGELLHQSGSNLVVFSEDSTESAILDMEPYLDDQKKMKYLNAGGERVADYFRPSLYYIKKEDGSIIPIKLLFSDNIDGSGWDTAFEIDFSDTNGLTQSDYNSYKTELSNSVIVNFRGKYTYRENANIYEMLYSSLREKIDPHTIYPLDGPKGGVSTNPDSWIGYSGKYGLKDYYMYMSELMDFDIDGEKVSGHVYYYTMDNMYKAAWQSSSLFNRRDAIIAAAILLLALNIGKAFYRKKKKVEESKRAFISAAAHELKTPIAVIQNQSELILEGINPEKTNEYVSSMHEEAKHMAELVNAIQQYDRLDNKAGITKETLDLSEITLEEIARYEAIMLSKGIAVETDIEQGVKIVGDENLVKLVIDNFLSNAAKYATGLDVAGAKRVKVCVDKDGNDARFSVFNTHEAIPESELAKVWQMLYKIDDSRKRESEENGGGMGLAISGRICELHKFKYGARNVDGGVEFYFSGKAC